MSDFPDYEAASRVALEMKDADYFDSRAIVDAALGDEPLYRINYTGDTKLNVYTEMLLSNRQLVQVYPKGDSE